MRGAGHDQVTVDDSGAFEFELLRAEAQRLTGFAAGFCLRVETTFDSGVRYEVDIPSMRADFVTPELVDWKPNVQFDGGFVGFDAAPFESSDAGALVAHRIELRNDGGIVWRWDSHRLGLDGTLVPEPQQLDWRVFGEFESDEMTVSARELRTGNDMFLGPTLTSVSTARVVMPAALPFRRVAWTFTGPCSLRRGNCPLTDRRLEVFELDERELELNLQATVFVDLIVVRGFVTASQYVEITVVDWLGKEHPFFVALPRSTFSADLEERFLSLPIDLGDNAAWLVRLNFPEPVTAIRELSVFRPE